MAVHADHEVTFADDWKEWPMFFAAAQYLYRNTSYISLYIRLPGVCHLLCWRTISQ